MWRLVSWIVLDRIWRLGSEISDRIFWVVDWREEMEVLREVREEEASWREERDRRRSWCRERTRERRWWWRRWMPSWSFSAWEAAEPEERADEENLEEEKSGDKNGEKMGSLENESRGDKLGVVGLLSLNVDSRWRGDGEEIGDL